MTIVQRNPDPGDSAIFRADIDYAAAQLRGVADDAAASFFRKLVAWTPIAVGGVILGVWAGNKIVKKGKKR